MNIFNVKGVKLLLINIQFFLETTHRQLLHYFRKPIQNKLNYT